MAIYDAIVLTPDTVEIATGSRVLPFFTAYPSCTCAPLPVTVIPTCTFSAFTVYRIAVLLTSTILRSDRI